VLRRLASAAVAVVAAIVLLPPLVQAMHPASATATLDRYTRDAHPATSTFRDAGFVAAFPDTPERSVHTGAFDGRAVTGASFESDPAPGYRFVVTYLDLPAAASGRERDVLDAAVASTAHSFDGTLASSRAVTFDGGPAVEFVVRDASSSGQFRGRIALAGTRLYVWGVHAPGASDALFGRFAGSFALVTD
jgi:hypothetical protein